MQHTYACRIPDTMWYRVLYYILVSGKTMPLHLSVAERRNLHTTVYASDALRVSVRMMYNVCDILL